MSTTSLSAAISFSALESGDSAAIAEFVSLLHEHGYVLLRFAAPAAAEVAALRATAANFFALPTDSKKAIGDFKHVSDTYAGYRDSASIDAEFLEVHTTREGGTYPPLSSPPGLADAAATLYRRLDGMARRLLHILATEGLGVDPEALLAPLDSLAGDKDISSSVLRVCHYRRRPPLTGSQASGEEPAEVEVLFDEHTDSSLLTLSTLCPGAPGLELRDAAAPDGGWLSIEQHPDVSELDVEVHVGDFLSFLTKDHFPSCVHRVTRPKRGPGRLSFPFLVRPRQDHVLDTRRFDPAGTNERLIEVSGIPLSPAEALRCARQAAARREARGRGRGGEAEGARARVSGEDGSTRRQGFAQRFVRRLPGRGRGAARRRSRRPRSGHTRRTCFDDNARGDGHNGGSTRAAAVGRTTGRPCHVAPRRPRRRARW